MSIKVEWATRSGQKLTCRFDSAEQAVQRLAILDALEANTQKYAPTDSGASRFSYIEEAKAIRAALSSRPPVRT